jgi:hypothetical protein
MLSEMVHMPARTVRTYNIHRIQGGWRVTWAHMNCYLYMNLEMSQYRSVQCWLLAYCAFLWLCNPICIAIKISRILINKKERMKGDMCHHRKSPNEYNKKSCWTTPLVSCHGSESPRTDFWYHYMKTMWALKESFLILFWLKTPTTTVVPLAGCEKEGRVLHPIAKNQR